MRKILVVSALALASISVHASNTINASDVRTSNGGNVQVNLNQLNGQVAGLGSDVGTLYNSKVDKSTQTARDAGQDAAIHDTYMLANTKYTEAAGKFLEGRVNEHDKQIGEANEAIDHLGEVAEGHAQAIQNNRDTIAANKADQAITDRDQDNLTKDLFADTQTKLDTKVDKSVYADDKATQTKTDAKQDRSIDNLDGKVHVTNQRIDEDRVAIKSNVDAITDESNQRAKADTALNDKVTQTNQALGNEAVVRADADNALQAQVNTKVETNVFTDDQSRQDKVIALKADRTAMAQQFADTDTRIAQQKADQAKVNKAVASTLDSHETRITGLEQSTNSQFKDLSNKIDKNEKKANAGTSTALAATGIPQVLADQTFALGAAIGGYEGESAIAVGFSARATKNITVKASVGTDTQSGVGYAVGTSIGW